MRRSHLTWMVLGLAIATGAALAGDIIGSDLKGNFGDGATGDSENNTVIATGYSAPSDGSFAKVNVLHDADGGGEKLVLYILRPGEAAGTYSVLLRKEFVEPAGEANTVWSADIPSVAVKKGDTFGFIYGQEKTAAGPVMFGTGTTFQCTWPKVFDVKVGESFSIKDRVFGPRMYGINVEFVAAPSH